MLQILILVTISIIFSTPTSHREPVFDPYIERFESYYNSPVKSTINFGTKFEGKVIGVCYYPFRKIEINKLYWDKASDTEKEMLIFHELGHCELHRDHNKSFILDNNNNEIPESLMYPKMFNPNIYLNYRDYYIMELFNE